MVQKAKAKAKAKGGKKKDGKWKAKGSFDQFAQKQTTIFC